MDINIKQWNETEGRIRYYKQSILKNGKKCNHTVFGVKDLKTLIPKKYKTFQKQVFTNGKWKNIK